MSPNETNLPPQTAYRKRLSEMLDLTYELEGLLHIGVTRSSVPIRLNQLIVDKLNALVALADEPAETPVSTPESTESSAPTPEEDVEYEYSEYAEDSEPDGDSQISEPSPTSPISPASLNSPSSQSSNDSSSFPSSPASPSPEEVQPSSAGSTQPKGVVFSINDRFLYARELFGGSVKNFDAAIDWLITLDSYDEAEEYLISEWNADPESPEAIRFLSEISKIFE